MKLSVKLLSALSLIAFVAVAVVGLSHSASAAVDAKVYVTNKASSLTTEPSTAVAGRTSATAVYGTYASNASTGTTARDIVANSDRFIVTVIDADLNTTLTVTSDSGAGYDADHLQLDGDVTQVAGSGFDGPGDKVQLTITDELATPIIGSNSDVVVYIQGSSPTKVLTGVSASIDFAGNGINAPLVTLQINYGSLYDNVKLGVRYPSSAVESITASIKSVVDTGGTAVLTLTETGRNTGRFEGEVLVKERRTSGHGFTAGTNGGSTASPATIPAIGGPITVTYVDAATSGTATNVSRTASYKIDTTVPTATISSPATASETQNRLPTFTGSVSDNESGLDVSLFSLNIDNTDDAANGSQIISGGAMNGALPTVIGKIASIDVSAKKDGITTLPFAYTETVVLPLASVTNPDHIVDFQVRAADLAGNYGYSDSKATNTNNTTGRAGNQPHTIKIDQIIPQISSAVTGKAWDATLATPAEKSNVRDSVVVRFDGKIKEASVSASDFQVVFSGAGGTFVPASFVVQGSDIYLDLDTTIPSNNKPTVKIQGTVQDLAGNSTDAGSSVATDGIKPVITVVRSAGTGTGTATEAADSLTNDKITITVTSDENLQGPPSIKVTDLLTSGAHVSALGNVVNALGVSKGGNTWSLVVAKGAAVQGNRGVTVSATDSAGNVALDGDAPAATRIYPVAYELDSVASAAVSTPANLGTTTQSNPFLTSDFAAGGEKSTVTISSATLDGDDVTSSVVASADSKTFFFQPTTALSNAEHTYIVKSVDAAGNKLTTTTKFKKSDRTDFVVTLFAGWNSLSFPSNPIDTDVNTVLSNSGVKQVVAYDATSPSQPWRIASKVGSAAYTSQTTPGLTSVTAGPGYWVETANFEDQKVSLEGPTGPGDARPGLTTIATGNGWNLVGVVDQSRSMTQKTDFGNTLQRSNNAGTGVDTTSATYFNTVNNGRAYTFDTVTSKFRELIDANPVAIGTGIWVFISPQTNGQLPHIVP